MTVSLPGASPTQLENDVARKIENSIATLQGLKHIYTKVQDGGATITAEFRLESPRRRRWTMCARPWPRVRGDLPSRCARPHHHQDWTWPGSPCWPTPCASARMDDEALSWFVDNDVAKMLLTVPGVGAVNRVGGVQPQGHVAADPLKLQALGATAADVSRQLRAGADRERRRPGPTWAAASNRVRRWPRCSRRKSWRA